ncbi:MAG: class A beta-lactamase-related serine hydrolase [Comamonadaceae bacterium]|nr:MAG: class A beta-lactamase-related serine hydrolase [Comamonadaceae bacterium]
MTSRRHLVLASAAALLAGACTTRRGAGNGRAPPTIAVAGLAAGAADWMVASPESQGIAPDALADVLRDGALLPALRALVVVRNGVLVGERYYQGASTDELMPVNSVTKSVASVLVGQALQQGRLPGLSASVGSLLPEAAAKVPGSAAARLTLQQILTGRTGLEYDWRSQTPVLAASADPIGMALALPTDPAAVDTWRYNDAAVNLLGPILARAHGRDLADVAARDLFAPLGIDRFAWARTGSGDPSTYGGLRLRPRDLARLAWTMADGGRWRGAQVVPAPWVAASLRPAGPADWRVAPVRDVGYGLLWFTGQLHGRRVAWGWGYGAQFALVVPELRLAVVTAATAGRLGEVAAQNNAVMGLVARVVNATA